MSPIDRLRRIARRALSGERLGEDSAWLAAAVLRYEREAAQGVTLDDAFGLSVSPGRKHWFKAEARARRDRALIELAHKYFADLPVIRQAEEIRRLIIRYESTAWIRDRNLTAAPAGYIGTPNELLFRAFTAFGGRVPSSAKMLVNVFDPTTADRRERKVAREAFE
jgi:hypothetical protein